MVVSIHEKKAVLAIGLVVLGLLIFQVPQTRAQFVISAWTYPDEYGQMLYGIGVYENSSGSWIHVYSVYYNTKDITIDWYVNASIKLVVTSQFNSCVTQADNYTHGQQFQRHNVTVTRPLRGIQTVYSQDNFTYVGAITVSGYIWQYEYYAVLDFPIIYGAIYTITVSYDVYYMEGI